MIDSVADQPTLNQTPRMYKGKILGPEYNNLSESEIRYIRDFSVAAFFVAAVWAFCNKLWLQAIVALVISAFGGGLAVSFYMAIWGRRSAWKKNSWQGFAEFRRHQKNTAWICFAVAMVLILLISWAGFVETR
ncbi:MAG: hypothetical protein HY461_02965 [Parcubacteria group bacterium]|nr:hypothetical protein [Parcubacteria group bacterium]